MTLGTLLLGAYLAVRVLRLEIPLLDGNAGSSWKAGVGCRPYKYAGNPI